MCVHVYVYVYVYIYVPCSLMILLHTGFPPANGEERGVHGALGATRLFSYYRMCPLTIECVLLL